MSTCPTISSGKTGPSCPARDSSSVRQGAITAPVPCSWSSSTSDAIAANDGGLALLSDDGDRLYARDRAAERDALARLRQLGAAGMDPHQVPPAPTIHERRLSSLVHTLVSDGWHVEAEGVRYRSVAAPTLPYSIRHRLVRARRRRRLRRPARRPSRPAAAAATRRDHGHPGRRLDGDAPRGLAQEVRDARRPGRPPRTAPPLRPRRPACSTRCWPRSRRSRCDAAFTQGPRAAAAVRGDRADATRRRASTASSAPISARASAGSTTSSEFGFGGSLADDMGLGKTVQVLALLRGAPRRPARSAKRPSLVVVPRSLRLQLDQRGRAVHPGPARARLHRAGSPRGAPTTTSATTTSSLTTYGTLRRDIARAAAAVTSTTSILDEAQAIKNADSQPPRPRGCSAATTAWR